MVVISWQVFGPVLAVASFSSEEEAVCIANASEYGLGAAVISDDKEVGGLIIQCQHMQQGVLHLI